MLQQKSPSTRRKPPTSEKSQLDLDVSQIVKNTINPETPIALEGMAKRIILGSEIQTGLSKKGLTADNKSHRSGGSGVGRRKNFKLSPKKISQLKYKVLLTLVSLFESNDASSNLTTRIMRGIPTQILTKNLVEVHELYKKIYDKNQYDDDLFGHQYQEDDKEDENANRHEQYDEFIIENGFNIYILLNIFIDSSKKRGAEEDEELNEFKQQNESIMENQGIFGKGIFGAFTKFGGSLLSEGFNILKKGVGAVNSVSALLKKNLVNNEGLDEEESTKVIEAVELKQKTRDAIAFFNENIRHIEVVIHDDLEKIYFPLLPYCKTLSKVYKKDFQESVVRSSAKTKLGCLMTTSDYMIRVMKHEKRLQKLFNTYKLMGIIANNGEIWEFCCFWSNLFLNLIIISSYSNKFQDRLHEPHLFFNKDIENTHYLITTIGVVNLVFSSLVVGFTLIKRGPILIEKVWRGFNKTKMNVIKRFIKFLVNIILSIYFCFTDFLFSYYVLFIAVAILGLTIHPFFFVIQLYDVVRIEVLTNVIKSVWIPKLSLFLTFLVFLMFQYYFTLIGYIVFSSHYNDGDRCKSLWECFFTTFDYTFKSGGSLGGLLVDPDSYEYMDATGNMAIANGQLNIYRLLFDDSFKIIMLMIIINMVAGIIINTFGALKEILKQKEEDIQGVCFICGLEREKLDKSSEQKHGFFSHIKVIYMIIYMWFNRMS